MAAESEAIAIVVPSQTHIKMRAAGERGARVLAFLDELYRQEVDGVRLARIEEWVREQARGNSDVFPAVAGVAAFREDPSQYVSATDAAAQFIDTRRRAATGIEMANSALHRLHPVWSAGRRVLVFAGGVLAVAALGALQEIGRAQLRSALPW